MGIQGSADPLALRATTRDLWPDKETNVHLLAAHNPRLYFLQGKSFRAVGTSHKSVHLARFSRSGLTIGSRNELTISDNANVNTTPEPNIS